MSQARGAATSSGAKSPRPTRAGGRQPLPEHLPRETVHHPAPCACPSCGGTRLSVLGEDVSKVLDYVPSYFKVVRHVRSRVSCRPCEAISQASMPSLPIERGRPGPALLAHILVAKYGCHRVSWNMPTKGGVEAACEMRAGPSEPTIRSGLQTPASCCRKERWW